MTFSPLSSSPVGSAARRTLLALVCLSLFAVGCSTSTTVEGADTTQAQAEDRSAQASAVPEPEPTDPTAVPDPTAAPERTAAPEPEPTESEVLDNPAVEAFGDMEIGDTTVVVSLIDAGAEPRIELRYDIEASCTELASMEQNQEMNQIINGDPMPSVGVVGQLTEIRVQAEPEADGLRVATEVTAARSTDVTATEVKGLLDAQLETLVGMRTTETITNSGLLVPDSTTIEGAESLGAAAETMTQLGQSARIGLPEEAIGVGGSWMIDSATVVQGMLLRNVLTYEVVAIDGQLVTLKTAQDQLVDEGASMEMAPGLSVDIVQWDASGTGTMVLDLQSLMPVSASIEMSAKQIFDGGALIGMIDQTIDVDTTITGSFGEGCTNRTRP